MTKLLITDHAWPDVSIETEEAHAAGFELIAGPAAAARAQIIEDLAADHQPAAILTCWAPVSARAIASSRALRVVARMGVGLDNIDVAACTARGIWVTNVPDYCVEEVSDHALALLLCWTRGPTMLDRSVKAGKWDPSQARLRRLSQMTVGIVGFGRIARRTIEKLAPWGCTILVCNRSRVAHPGITQVGLLDLMGRSDAVILHVPLAPGTHHFIDRSILGAVKRGAFLINVSRGAVVDTAALLAALESGALAGAGLDVIEGEPTPPPELIARSDVIVTPHVAFSSDASIAELRRRAVASAIAVLKGNLPPPNACNDPGSADALEASTGCWQSS